MQSKSVSWDWWDLRKLCLNSGVLGPGLLHSGVFCMISLPHCLLPALHLIEDADHAADGITEHTGGQVA